MERKVRRIDIIYSDGTVKGYSTSAFSYVLQHALLHTLEPEFEKVMNCRVCGKENDNGFYVCNDCIGIGTKGEKHENKSYKDFSKR